MHTIKLNVTDNVYNHLIFLLKNINPEELEIIEDKVVTKSTKDLIKEHFDSQKIELFKEIENPLLWQNQQREDW
jgi:hypothetical protein